MSLKQIFEDDSNFRCLKIKIISKQGKYFIVGDTGALSILIAPNVNYEDMEREKCYIVQKPIKKDEHSFVPNEKTKPINIKAFQIQDRKQEYKKLTSILSNLIESSENKKNMTTNLLTFEVIKAQLPQAEVASVTAKVINISKDINGKFGNYNIVKLKDISSKTIDMNLYKTQIKKNLETGKIVEFRLVTLTKFVKDGQDIHRLATTSKTTCKTSENSDLFANVPLGDIKVYGRVVAIEDIFSYNSCSKCWKRVEDGAGICQCGHNENPVKDFHCNFYIEKQNDNEIEAVHTFRRLTNIFLDSLEIQKVQRELDDKFLMKTFTFEWNVDNDKDIFRMVKISEKEA